MRSVAVVFPASMCAEIPMLRYRSMGVVRAICSRISRRFAPNSTGSKRPRPTNQYMGRPGIYQPALPAVVRERLVGLGHAVGIFTLAHGRAAIRGAAVRKRE